MSRTAPSVAEFFQAIARNAAANGVKLEIRGDADRALASERFDVLLAADVCYELPNRELLATHARFPECVLLSDPARRGAPLACVDRLAEYRVRTLPDLAEETTGASIYRCRSKR